MNNEFSSAFKKISMPALVISVAIAFLIIGLRENQSSFFKITGVFLLLAGIIALFLSVSSKIAKIAVVIGGVLGIASVFIYSVLFLDIYRTFDNRNTDEEIDELIKQNLNDIKTTQIAFKEVNGRYASDFDELKEFIINGKVKFVSKMGGVPARRITPEERAIIYGPGDRRPLDYNMTEEEALKLSKSANPPSDLSGFVRDTILKSFYNENFGTENYIKRRSKMGFPDFNVDSIFVIPRSGNAFTMEIKDSVEFQSTIIQGIEVKGERKLLSFRDSTAVYSFGSLISPALSTNWD
jgi:hypothetical protein